MNYTLDGDVYGLTVLPNYKLASYSLDCTLKIWNSKNGQYITTLPGHKSIINHVILLSTGQLASCGVDTKVCNKVLPIQIVRENIFLPFFLLIFLYSRSNRSFLSAHHIPESFIALTI